MEQICDRYELDTGINRVRQSLPVKQELIRKDWGRTLGSHTGKGSSFHRFAVEEIS
jgi:hypothetical protein